jgi:hypothetical protein
MFMGSPYTHRCVHVKNKINSGIIRLRSAAYRQREIHDKNVPMAPKNQAAMELGRRGGKATARNRTKAERREAAKKAIEARWAKTRKLVDQITAGTKALEERAKLSAKASNK